MSHSYRPYFLFCALLLGGCKDITQVQTGYVADRDDCRGRSEDRVALYNQPGAYPMNEKEKNNALITLFNDCMREYGWNTGPAPKPKPVTVAAAPIVTTPTASGTVVVVQAPQPAQPIIINSDRYPTNAYPTSNYASNGNDALGQNLPVADAARVDASGRPIPAPANRQPASGAIPADAVRPSQNPPQNPPGAAPVYNYYYGAAGQNANAARPAAGMENTSAQPAAAQPATRPPAAANAAPSGPPPAAPNSYNTGYYYGAPGAAAGRASAAEAAPAAGVSRTAPPAAASAPAYYNAPGTPGSPQTAAAPNTYTTNYAAPAYGNGAAAPQPASYAAPAPRPAADVAAQNAAPPSQPARYDYGAAAGMGRVAPQAGSFPAYTAHYAAPAYGNAGAPQPASYAARPAADIGAPGNAQPGQPARYVTNYYGTAGATAQAGPPNSAMGQPTYSNAYSAPAAKPQEGGRGAVATNYYNARPQELAAAAPAAGGAPIAVRNQAGATPATLAKRKKRLPSQNAARGAVPGSAATTNGNASAPFNDGSLRPTPIAAQGMTPSKPAVPCTLPSGGARTCGGNDQATTELNDILGKQ